MKRREFLKKGCLWSAGAMLPLGLGPLSREARALLDPSAPKDPVLVFVFLRGGVDQLSFLPPLEDARYLTLRRETAERSATFKLTSPFALHPRARDLIPLWRNKNLSFIVQTGLPAEIRSHSDAETFLELGGEQAADFRDGFLFRVANQLPRRHFVRAVALQPTTPVSLMGPGDGVLSFGGLRSFELMHGRAAEPGYGDFQALYEKTSDSLLKSAVHSAFLSIQDFASLKSDDYRRFSDKFPATTLGRRFADIAWLIRNRPQIPVYATEMRQWDTHANQGVTDGLFADLVSELSSAIFALSENLGPDWGRTTVVAVTEFGRTAEENGSAGTDHGHGSLALVAGGRVRGGQVFGSWRELKKENLFEERDLPITTDSRVFLSEILREHLGIRDLGAVFPGFSYQPRHKLGLFS